MRQGKWLLHCKILSLGQCFGSGSALISTDLGAGSALRRNADRDPDGKKPVPEAKIKLKEQK